MLLTVRFFQQIHLINIHPVLHRIFLFFYQAQAGKLLQKEPCKIGLPEKILSAAIRHLGIFRRIILEPPDIAFSYTMHLVEYSCYVSRLDMDEHAGSICHVERGVCKWYSKP